MKKERRKEERCAQGKSRRGEGATLEGKEGQIDRRVMLVLYCLVPFFIRRCS
jgi:hypothetical protein